MSASPMIFREEFKNIGQERSIVSQKNIDYIYLSITKRIKRR